LAWASYELQADREVVMEAVKQDGRSLQYASNELKLEMAECWVKCMEENK